MPKKILMGKVVSHKMEKTAVVQVSRVYVHPIYKKNVTKRKKYAAHDEHNMYREGMWVQIQESRPISKRKHWEVVGEVLGVGS